MCAGVLMCTVLYTFLYLCIPTAAFHAQHVDVVYIFFMLHYSEQLIG